MSSKKKNISKNDDGYDDVGYFCGWIKKKSSKNVNIEQSRISVNKQQRNSLYKSALDASNHNGTSQFNQLNSTNSETQRKNSDISPFVSSFAIPIFENNYPLNQLFQLKNNQSGDSIFAKITSTKIEVPKSMGFNEDICNNPKISDQISKYIATRIKDQINSLAEFGCGDGGNTVQVSYTIKNINKKIKDQLLTVQNQIKFAKYLDFVIAIDKSTEACLRTRKNCDQDTLNQDFPNPKVEIINSDIFKLKRRLPFDSIFINPTINTENSQICKDLLKDCQPNLQQLLMMTSDQIENLIIQFPAQIDYSQLPLLLNINQQYQNNTQHKYQSLVSQHNQQQSFIAHCSLEIEKIYANGIHIQNIIYYGKIANITREELRSILITQLQNQEVKPEAIQNLITKLKDKIGMLFPLVQGVWKLYMNYLKLRVLSIADTYFISFKLSDVRILHYIKRKTNEIRYNLISNKQNFKKYYFKLINSKIKFMNTHNTIQTNFQKQFVKNINQNMETMHSFFIKSYPSKQYGNTYYFREFSQNTFNYHHKLRDSTHEVQESEYAYSPKFSYNLNGLQMDDTNSIDEIEDNIEALGLSQEDKKSKLK